MSAPEIHQPVLCSTVCVAMEYIDTLPSLVTGSDHALIASVSKLVWNRLKRAAAEDYRFNPDCFRALQSLLSVQFDLDCCSNDTGDNALCQQYASPSQSFLDMSVAGKTCWINPPFSMLHEFIQHYVQQKASSPTDTSACIVVPKWGGKWRKLLKGMTKVIEYPAGTALFDVPDSTAARRKLPGCPWPIQVYWDPPSTPPTLGFRSKRRSQLKMTFRASFAGLQGVALADTGASNCFTSSALVNKLGLKVHTAGHSKVELASGKTQALLGTVNIPMRLGKSKQTVTAFVMDDFLEGVDLILGEDWMDNHNAVLDYASYKLVFHQHGKKYVVSHNEPSPEQVVNYCFQVLLANAAKQLGVPLLLSAKQMARELRHPSQPVFLIVVKDETRYLEEELASESSAHKWKDKSPGTYICEPKCSRKYTLMSAQASLQGVTGAEGPRIGPSDIPAHRVLRILDKHKTVFEPSVHYEELPDRQIGHTISCEAGHKPPWRPIYRLSPAELEEVKRQVADLLKKGYIEPSKSPYGAPILFTPKPDGTLRMCVDYRALNKLTVKNRYPLPRIDDLLDQLSGARYFTSLDLQSGYHQIKITPEDMPKTAFRTPIGHFQFRVLAFGLSNCPSTFQNVMNDVFKDKIGKFVLVYMDDILIFSKTAEEHLEHIDQVLGVLKDEKLRCKLSKCKFAMTELRFVGHLVTREGIRMDPEKTRPVKEWPEPKNLRALRGVLGFGNYFRKYIQGYSSMVAPLTALTKANVPWEWNAPQRKAFNALKQALTSDPVLAMPDFTRKAGTQDQLLHPFEVICDASVAGVGAVLMQNGKPVAYYSKKFIPAEVNYTTTEQEMLAVVNALQEFRCYVEGVEFTLITDHNPLTYFNDKTTLSRKQARWQELLSNYRYKWKHIPGRTNVADPISRMYCDVLLATGKAKHQSEDQLTDIAAGYKKDKWFREEKNIADLQQDDNGLYWKGRLLVIPNAFKLRSKIIKELHDSPYAGHGGVKKTVELVSRDYWWPGLTKDVAQYVKQCDLCQRNKSTNQKPVGLLKPLEAPKRKWESVSMDYITQLPRTKSGHDAILVFVDRLTKMTHFVPTVTSVTAEDTAKLFIKHVVRLHGLPDNIVSDRDPRFTSAFWAEVCSRLGIKRKMSTAFHPQTDGQTERMNRTLEDMLRHYVSPTQDDWDEHLDMAEFAINNTLQASTNATPFFLNYGVHPVTPGTVQLQNIKNTKAPSSEQFTKDMQANLEKAMQSLQAARSRQKRYADSKRRDVRFQLKDKVMLSTKNIPLKAVGTRKLLPKFIGPFEVIGLVGDRAVRLKLPDSYKIHDVFHVSLVKPYHGAMRHPPPCDFLQGEALWTVERLLNHRKSRNKMEYLVKWEGFGEEHNTWEPDTNLLTCDELISAYWRSVGSQNLTDKAKRQAAGSGPMPTRKRPRKH